MTQPEMSVTGLPKGRKESFDAINPFTKCNSKKSRGESFNSEKTNSERIMEDKKTEVGETTVEKINEEWDFPIDDDKTKSKNIEKVSTDSTKPIQNAHPISSRENSHLFNYFSKMDDIASGISIVNWECESSLPWSRTGQYEEKMSVPMFLYLLNNDIKSEIFALDQKEWEACHAKKWGEALRLRGLTNKLNLTREHQLLDAVGLKLNEQLRSAGMKSIAKRQDVVDKREKLISDGSLHSEEARELWKKWEIEDDQLEMNSSFIERGGLMESLEEEWKILTDEDKERISQFYGKIKPELPTDYRHKITQQYP